MDNMSWVVWVSFSLGILLTVTSCTHDQYSVPASASGAVFVSIGSFMMGKLQEAKELRKVQLEHDQQLKALRIELQESGQEFLVKQYADDTVDAALVTQALKEINLIVDTSDPVNGLAIKQTLRGIERQKFKDFVVKAGELLHKEDGAQLLEKYLAHLRQVIATRNYIPEELQEKIEELADLLKMNQQKIISTEPSPDDSPTRGLPLSS